MSQSWNVVWDIEANNLLNSESIDYLSVPYRLKDTFKIHCIVCDVVIGSKRFIYAFYDGETIVLDGRKHSSTIEGNTYELDNYEPQRYIHKQLAEFASFVKAIPQDSVVAGHNIINYDLLAIKLYFGIDYEIEVDMSISTPIGDTVS